VSTVYVPARSVVIDNEIADSEVEGVEMFSGLHEGGHLIIHPSVFLDGYGVPYERDSDTASVIVCRRENIERGSNGGGKVRTPADWREHQADYFASAIAMPDATFRPFVNRLLRENGVYTSQIKLGRDSDLDILAKDLLPEYIRETYGVSKRAASIKLRKQGFVIGGWRDGNTVR
jgi:Zn-dependent peptidase ImmA (M78 family)